MTSTTRPSMLRKAFTQPAFTKTWRSLSVAAVLAASGAAAQAQGAFSLTSPDLATGRFDNAFVLNAFGCHGQNLSPELKWANLPAGTKSLALQIHDPDAPQGKGFWHWAVYNIPASATGLARGAGTSAATLPVPAFGGNTDFLDTGATGGNGNYGGPCPPSGDAPHRYTFVLYALGVDDLPKAAGIPKTGSASLYSFILNKALGNNLLGTASLTATYGR